MRDVLVPRPESELLVDTATELLLRAAAAGLRRDGREPPLRLSLLDLGCGSGALTLATAHAFARAAPAGTPLRCVGVDRSEAAVLCSTRNATLLRPFLPGPDALQLRFALTPSWAAAVRGEQFDVVVSK